MKLQNLLEADDKEFRNALRVIARTLVDESNLEYLQSGDAELEDYVAELVDPDGPSGRWMNMLADEVRDQLIARTEEEETVTMDYMQANPDPSKVM